MKPPKGFFCCFTLALIWLLVVGVIYVFITTR